MKQHKKFFAKITGVMVAVAAGWPAASLAQHWYWTGDVSENWSDVANWNSATNRTGVAPADISELTNKNLMLLTTGANLPSNQDIADFAVNQLMFDATVTSFEINGKPIQLNNTINNNGNPATAQAVTFRNDLVLNSSGGWRVESRLSIYIYGSVSETGGSRSFAANFIGNIHFLGPVTITGGFKNNQTTAVFYGIETTGAHPAEFDNAYFSSGHGTMRFRSPDGGRYDYEFGDTVGVRTTTALALNVDDNVTVTFAAPVCEDATSGRALKKNGDGVLYLNGTNTFSGTLSADGGMVVLGAPLTNSTASATIGGNSGVDLNGHDVTGRKPSFSNTSGFHSSGTIRNSAIGAESLLTGDFNNIASSGTVIQFGGGGDIRLTGNITNTTANSHRIAKTGAGRLTFTGESTYNGPWHILGGRLDLDYGSHNTSKIGDSATLALHGDLLLFGNSRADTVETIDTLQIGGVHNVMANRVRIQPYAMNGNDMTLRFTTLAASSTVIPADFSPQGPDAHIRTQTTENDANIGIIAPRFTFRGATYARVAESADADGYYEIEGLPTGDYVTGFDPDTEYEIVDITADTSVDTATEIAAALRFNADSVTLTLNKDLRLRGGKGYSGYQGAILVSRRWGAEPMVIDGSGTLCSSDVNGSLHIMQYDDNAPLIIGARVSSASSGSGLTKSGPGELVLTNRLNTFAGLYIYEGTVTASSVANNGTASAAGFGSEILLGTAAFKYTGEGDTTDKLFKLRGHGTLDASGSGPLVLTRATPVATAEGNDHRLTLDGSGEGVVLGKLDLKVGSLRKTGSGSWTLGGDSVTNFFWGSTVVEDGRLVVDCDLGRDVTVAAGGTLAGCGRIQHNLALAGTLEVDPDAGVLFVGNNIMLDGAAFTVAGRLPRGEFVEILACGGTISGEFTDVPDKYKLRYTANTVEAQERIRETLFILR